MDRWEVYEMLKGHGIPPLENIEEHLREIPTAELIEGIIEYLTVKKRGLI
jgi:hypothetical protein